MYYELVLPHERRGRKATGLPSKKGHDSGVAGAGHCHDLVGKKVFARILPSVAVLASAPFSFGLWYAVFCWKLPVWKEVASRFGCLVWL
jgi:hypothetical protein